MKDTGPGEVGNPRTRPHDTTKTCNHRHALNTSARSSLSIGTAAVACGPPLTPWQCMKELVTG